jgi:sigma-B regulation protein RsbU (phosphoserine phosphatase)
MAEEMDILRMHETIADSIGYHILVCNLQGQIVFSNKTMQTYLGYSKLELKQKNFFDIVVDKHINRAKSLIIDASKEPSSWEGFLFNGKHNFMELYIQVFQKNNLIYIYGNKKYVEYERICRKLDFEITNAAKIQKSSLPKSLPNTENISFDSMYIPAQKLGGDLFDVFKVDNGLLNDYFEQYVCFIADVSGHGIDSAMLSIFIKDTIRSFFTLKYEPGQLLSPKEIMNFLIEQYIKEGYPDEYLVCIFLGVFDLKTNELTYCNAGIHKRPILIIDNENITELNYVGLPISTAIEAELLKFEERSIYLSPGMTLIFMSDGLPDQRSNKQFYEPRLKNLLIEIYNLRPSDIIKEIQEDFNDFLNEGKIHDDITLIVAKLK